jgi:nucleotide-binding universal stress UspA family protein
MVKHVLVAIDGSASSLSAAQFAMQLARQLSAKVTLLTVLPEPEVIPLGPVSGYAVLRPAINEADLQRIRERLDTLVSEDKDVVTERRVEVGPVAETIIDIAEKGGMDLIVMGARGFGPGRRFLLGSVSDRVVHHAHCPVTVWR